MTFKITQNDIDIIDKAIEKTKEVTRKDVIKLGIYATAEQLSIFDSKVGGVPYLPLDVEVPRDSNNRQLSFLAQYDCSKLPNNDIFPKSGMLQFWIGRDILYGLEDKKGFRVLYYETIDTNLSSEDVLKKYQLPSEDNNDCSPIVRRTDNFKINFSETQPTYSTRSVVGFEDLFVQKINEVAPEKNVTDYWDDVDDELNNHISEYLSDSGNIIGGYPTFRQYDPRTPEDERDVVLFQLDSQYDLADFMEIIWGDEGIGCFLISKEDLENLNFDNVLYTWDCY